MAITRLQLPREMYASGELVAGAPSIKYEGDMRPEMDIRQPEMDIRQPYGLGSIVKKIGRGIKKVVDNPIVQTALMLNPATAPYAAAYSGLKSGNPIGAYMAMQGMNNPDFMKLGVGPNMREVSGSTIGNLGNLAKGKNALDLSNKSQDSSLFGNIRDALFYKKGTDKIDPLKIALGAGAGLLGIGALQKRANEKQPKLEDMIGDRGSKIGLDDIQMKVQAAINSGDKATYENLKVTENLAFLPPWESIQKAEGGRIGYDQGGITGMLEKNPEFFVDFVRKNKDQLYENQKLLENKEVVNTLMESILDKNRNKYPNTPEGQQKMYQDAIIEVRETIQGFNYADGGRIGYAAGGQTSAEMLQLIERLRAEGKTELEIQQILQQMFQNRMSFPEQGIQSLGYSGPASFVDTVITKTGAGGKMPTTTDIASIQESAPIMKTVSNRDAAMMGAMKRLPDWTRDATEVPQEAISLMEGIRTPRPQEPLPEISPYGAAQGGRINKAGGGIMSMGGMEMDLRGGGFVPIGKAEKADDVPARLSKNEFVFTADAVRAAGGGDVDQGADKMYRTMKQLESRVG